MIIECCFINLFSQQDNKYRTDGLSKENYVRKPWIHAADAIAPQYRCLYVNVSIMPSSVKNSKGSRTPLSTNVAATRSGTLYTMQPHNIM